MKSIAVFCGSSIGVNENYGKEAFKLGALLAKKSITIVYGGGSVGLMGKLADGALNSNGIVIGVMPKFLIEKEIAHKGLTQLIQVDTMHQRKRKIEKISDGFIVLPGGHGSMEEFFEISTLAQLGLHCKPISILNVNGYYDELINFSRKTVSEGFTKNTYHNMLIVDNDTEKLLERMKNYVPSITAKWVTKDNI